MMYGTRVYGENDIYTLIRGWSETVGLPALEVVAEQSQNNILTNEAVGHQIWQNISHNETVAYREPLAILSNEKTKYQSLREIIQAATNATYDLAFRIAKSNLAEERRFNAIQATRLAVSDTTSEAQTTMVGGHETANLSIIAEIEFLIAKRAMFVSEVAVVNATGHGESERIAQKTLHLFLENEKTFPKTLIKRNSQRVPPAIYCRLLVALQMRNCDDIWSQSEKLNRKSVTKNRETFCGHKLYFQFKNL